MIIGGQYITIGNVTISPVSTDAGDGEEDDAYGYAFIGANYTNWYPSSTWADTKVSLEDNIAAVPGVAITGNGTYTITVDPGDAFTGFGALCVDFYKLLDAYPELEVDFVGLTVDGVDVDLDTTAVRPADNDAYKALDDATEGIIYGDVEDNGNYRMEIANAYGKTNGASNYTKLSALAGETYEITFTVSGLPEAPVATFDRTEEIKKSVVYDTNINTDAINKLTVFLMGDAEKDEAGAFTSGEELAGIYGVRFNITMSDEVAQKILDGETWMGGAVVYNSDSTGWTQYGFTAPDGGDNITITKTSDGHYAITFINTDENGDVADVFASTDTYAQFILCNWGNTADGNVELYNEYDVESVELLGIKKLPGDDEEGDGNTTEPGTTDPVTSTVDSTAPGATTTTTSSTTKPDTKTTSSTGDKDKASSTDANPSTGAAALATVGVLLAGAAVVASKKKD